MPPLHFETGWKEMTNFTIILTILLFGAGCQTAENYHILERKCKKEWRLDKEKGVVQDTSASMRVEWKT